MHISSYQYVAVQRSLSTHYLFNFTNRMPTTVGIAGITSKFASLVLNRLLSRPNVNIRGFCRNAYKLLDSVRASPCVTLV